jgi:hypothetical protein
MDTGGAGLLPSGLKRTYSQSVAVGAETGANSWLVDACDVDPAGQPSVSGQEADADAAPDEPMVAAAPGAAVLPAEPAAQEEVARATPAAIRTTGGMTRRIRKPPAGFDVSAPTLVAPSWRGMWRPPDITGMPAAG